jgi:hypothetical protein
VSGRATLAAIIHGALDREARGELARRFSSLAGRDVELLVVGGATAPGPSTPASRNAAVAAASADYFVFLDARARESSFLAPACRLLDRAPEVAFVSTWASGLPARPDSVARPLTIDDLLARSWLTHVPTVIRKDAWARAGGFDELMIGCDDVDLLLRLLQNGVGLGLADPFLHDRAWGDPFDWLDERAEAALRRLFEKHRRLVEEHWEGALLGKERMARELFELRAPADAVVRSLAREAEELDEERARLEAVLARLRTACR